MSVGQMYVGQMVIDQKTWKGEKITNSLSGNMGATKGYLLISAVQGYVQAI